MSRRNLFFVGIMFMVLLVLAACQGPVGPTGPAGSPGPAGPAGQTGPAGEVKVVKAAIVVVPMEAKAASKIVVYGSGFVPGEKVRIELSISKDTRVVLSGTEMAGVIVANENGAFKMSQSTGIPPAAVIPAGAYSLAAIGDKGTIATTPLVVIEEPKK